MNKRIKLLAGGLSIALISVVGSGYLSDYTASKKIEKQRKKHAEFLKNSPYKESLTWDKKKRKLKGLPPNRYFEQMWELSIDPATGRLDDGKITKVREDLIRNRTSRRSPGEEGNSWVERGPNNIGGRTRVILFDPNDAANNTVYAGGVSGGLWRNTDISNANSQWARVEGVPGNLSVTSISVDPRNSNTWYIGTGEQYTGGDVVGNGVYVSTNGGTTWNSVNIPAAGGGDINHSATSIFLSGVHFVNDILAWDNGASTELFVAVGAHVYGDSGNPRNYLGLQSAGLYRSTDSGVTWNRIETASMRHTFSGNNYYYIPNDLEVSANNTLWMGTIKSLLGENGGGRLFSSTDGATWTEAAASPLTESNRVEIEPSATNGNKLYVLAQGTTSATPVRIFKTTNGFASVTTSSLPNDADTGIAANDFCRGQAFYDLVIEADPSNDDVLYVGGIDLFKSTNGASSWTQLSHWYGGFGQANNVHADQHSIAFGNNSSSKILFGNDGGVYYSGNSGTTISSRNKGYNVTQFVKAAIGPDGAGDVSGIFTAGAQDNGTQGFRNAVAGINSSTEVSGGDGFYTFIDKDGEYMIATYVNNVIHRFNLPWNGVSRIQGGSTSLLNDQNSGDFVNPMDYDSDANRLLTNASTSAAKSIKSINVASNTKGNITNALLTAKPTAFRASPFANNTWYVGLADGNLVKLTNVTNSSATWTNVVTPFVGSISSVRYGATANDIFVTIHNYGVTSVWATSDAGANWVNKEGNLPNIPVRDFLQNPLSRNEAIIATQLGVWSTSNFNAANPAWTQAYNGMSDVSVTSFDYWNVSGDHTQNKIIASTYGRGVFTGEFTANVVADNEAPTAASSLAASSVTASSLTLNWTAASDNVAVTGYDVYQGTTKLGTATGTTYNVTGLTASTAYTFSVKAKDAAGNVSSASNIVNVTTPVVTISYCTSKGASVNDEYIQKVVLGTINNTSTGGNGYSDHTSISTDLTKGESNTITITPKWTSTVYNEGYGVWIDYNQDGDFSDAGETVWTKAKSKTTPVSGTFTVPSSALSGATRMRVVLKYNATPTACETSIEYGEVEDYTVVIGSVQADTTAPSVPSSASATSVTQTTLILNWSASTDNVAVTEYDVYQGATKIGSTANTTTNVTGLTAATGYTFSIKAKDAAGNVSSSSNTVSVTTLAVPVSYCDSKGTRVTYEWIDYVAFGGMTNTTAANGGYGDFTSKVATVALGSTNQLVLSAGFSGTAYNEHFTVWIDYNRDGDFTDAGEQVTTGNSSSTTNRITDVVIPSTATLGQTRMRVSMKYNTAPTSCEANLGDGEVEDYTVNIIATPVVAVAAVSGETIKSQESLDLKAYPNPSVDFVKVKLASKSANMTYKIVNTIGSVVQSGYLDSSRINVSDLKTGMYILEVNDGQKVLTTKLLKK
ncbi:GEVED domain-containing protein [Tenacibaculum ovolyticum]|uniref:GEVED domain-containing protein n=1 Tax=Tenacibaculum ovolyticum TaxID=104270 RepID=UPI003BA8CDEB